MFSLNPQDLPSALAKAEELESNNIRANFALQFTTHRNKNHAESNRLRFPQRSDQHNNEQPHKHMPRPEPMELGSSVNRPINTYNNNQFRNQHQNNSHNPFRDNTGPRWQKPNYNTYNNPTRPLFKREKETSIQRSTQPPPVKMERINNLNEGDNK